MGSRCVPARHGPPGLHDAALAGGSGRAWSGVTLPTVPVGTSSRLGFKQGGDSSLVRAAVGGARLTRSVHAGTRVTSMMRTVRFLTGLAMVVAGVSLAAPMATQLVNARLGAADSARPPGAIAGGDTAAAAWAGAFPAGAPGGTAAAGGGFCIPDVRSPAGPAAALSPLSAPSAPATFDSGSGAAAGYEPPPAPVPLPAIPAEVSLAPPPVEVMYRSTLDVPPPPLLDAAAPAPLAVSRASYEGPAGVGVVRMVSAEGAPAPQPAGLQSTAPPTVVPSTYAVRDGDDLTSIATRLYGHPGAAEAIWTANRDRLADPAVLPIGIALRIPPSWVPPAARVTGAGADAVIEPSRRPAKVRVAPGETFESLAVRFYGNGGWANRLWEANRDQVRDPALLVAGIELRLP